MVDGSRDLYNRLPTANYQPKSASDEESTSTPRTDHVLQ